jgi:hypothetical protein
MSACGGGGSADAPVTASTGVFNLQSPWRARVVAGSNDRFNVSGTCRGTAVMTATPARAATFEGVAGFSAVNTVSTTFADCTPSTSSSTSTDFYDANLSPLGSSSPDEYVKFQTPPPALPTVLKVGDSAVYAGYTVYGDSSKARVVGSRVLSYAVEADTATSVIVNLSSRDFDPSSRLLYTEQQRYRLDSTGLLTILSIDAQESTVGSKRLVFTKV